MRKDKNPDKAKAATRKNTAKGEAAWARVTAQTRPLDAAQRDKGHDGHAAFERAMKAPLQKAKNPEKAAATRPSKRPPVPPPTNRAGPAMAAMDKPLARKPASGPRPEIDQKARRRLARGRLAIDATLDMHGMTLVEAEAALRGFVAYHRTQGHQWVLVVTGKGMRGEGRLRRALPGWLAAAPLAAQIVEYDMAAIPHGGGGAFYLRLRRA